MIHQFQTQFFLSLMDPTKEIIDFSFAQSPRLIIYRNNVRNALIKALKATYPHILDLSGEKRFIEWAREYIANHPSEESDLNHYGAHFATWIKKSDLTLAAVAKFEWICHQLFFVHELKIPIEMHEKCLENLKLCLNNTIRIERFNFSLFDLLEKKFKSDLPLTQKSNYFLIQRRNEQLVVIKLAAHEYCFLSGLKKPKTVRDALASIPASNHQTKLFAKLTIWLQKNILMNDSR